MWLTNTFSKNSFNKKRAASAQAASPQHTLHDLDSNGVELSMLELMSYAPKTALINLNATKNLHGKMSGNYLSRSKGRGMEFDEVRHYQNGDDIRAIDWRVTAKTGVTHTKLFKEEVERPVLIATDLSSNMLFGSELLFKSIQAAHLAALVAWHAQKRGDRIGGIVFNEHQHSELKPRSRKQAVLHYLHQLTQTHANSFSQLGQITETELKQESVENNLMRLRQLAKPGSLVYFISDGHFLNADAIRHFNYIAKHCELVVCLIHDPLEQQLPQTNERQSVAINNGQSVHHFTLGDKKLAEQYQQQAQAAHQKQQALITKTGARVIELSAAESIEQQLKRSGAL